MYNIEALLEQFAGGDVDPTALIKRKKNAPPMGSLLPSQAALSDMAEGAGHAMAEIGSRESSTPDTPPAALASQGGGTSAAAGAGMGLLQGIQNAVRPAPWQTPPPSQSAARDNAIQSVLAQPPPMQISGLNRFNPYGMEEDEYSIGRGLAYGGEIDDGEIVRVGNEWVKKTRDGRVFVIPNDDPAVRAQDALAERPEIAAIVGDEPIDLSRFTPIANPEPQTGAESSRMADVPNQTGVAPTPQGQPNMGDLMGTQIPDVEGNLYRQLFDIQNEKGSKWKDAGFGMLQGLNNYLNRTNAPIQSYSEMRKAQKAQPILNKIGMIEGRKQRDLATKKAHADIYADITNADARKRAAQTDAEQEKRLGDQWIAEKTGKGDRFAIGKRQFQYNKYTGEVKPLEVPKEPTNTYTLRDGTPIDLTEEEYKDWLLKSTEWSEKDRIAAGKDDVKAIEDWDKTVRKIKDDEKENIAKLETATNLRTQLAIDTKALDKQIAQLKYEADVKNQEATEKLDYSDNWKDLEKIKRDNEAKIRELDADIQTRGKAKFELPPRPTPRTPATTTGAITPAGRGKSLTKDAIRKAAKDKGVSYEKALSDAQVQEYTIID